MTLILKSYSRKCWMIIGLVFIFVAAYLILKLFILKEDELILTRIIHQSWKSKTIPPMFMRYFPSWKTCFPDWEHRFWTDEDNEALIAKYYPWFLSKYLSFPESIHRADCARYAYLHLYGGLYTDLDNECLVPFEHLLSNYSLVFGTIDHVGKATPLKENYVQNSFMYSKPNDPIWMEILIGILLVNDTRTPDIVTGPIPLSNAIDKYRKRFPESHGIKIYEGRYFNPMTWGNQKMNPAFCKINNQMTQDEYLKCREYHAHNGSYVVQYHTHVWG